MGREWEAKLPLSSDDRVKYSRAVFAEFVHAHRSRIFSSAEFNLVRRWIDRDIPLAAVLQGIRETTCDPRTLLACEKKVEEQAKRRSQALQPGIWEAQKEAQWSQEQMVAERERILAKHRRVGDAG